MWPPNILIQIHMSTFYCREMEENSSIVPLPKSAGKELMTQSEDVSLSMLKASDIDKAINVKAYRKWTVANKEGRPVLFCCMLLDKQV